LIRIGYLSLDKRVKPASEPHTTLNLFTPDHRPGLDPVKMDTPLINHRQALENLLRFEGSVSELERPWQRLPYDYDGLPVVLTMAHIKHALQRRIDEDITAKDLEIWADLVEGRPGIEYEDEEQCSDLLFRLSTPEINQPLSVESCRHILAELK
jgi:hypothetical protein